MVNDPRATKYMVEFFETKGHRGAPSDTLRLKADNDSDAVAQAHWLARHTYHDHFQVRAVAGGLQTIIYRSYSVADLLALSTNAQGTELAHAA